MTEPDELFAVDEIATTLKMNPQTIRNWIGGHPSASSADIEPRSAARRCDRRQWLTDAILSKETQWP